MPSRKNALTFIVKKINP